MGRSFLSEVERPSILRTGLPVAPSLSYRLATGLSAPAPAQRAGAQRLRALGLFRRRFTISRVIRGSEVAFWLASRLHRRIADGPSRNSVENFPESYKR